MITEKYDFEDAQNGGKKDGISLDEKTTSFENKELTEDDKFRQEKDVDLSSTKIMLLVVNS